MDVYQARDGLTRTQLKRAYYGLLYRASPAMIHKMFNLNPNPVMQLTPERRNLLLREVANLIETDEIVASGIIARIVDLRRDGHSNHNIQVILALREGDFLPDKVDSWVLNMLQMTQKEYEFWVVGVILETIDWHLAWGMPEFRPEGAKADFILGRPAGLANDNPVTGRHFDQVVCDDLGERERKFIREMTVTEVELEAAKKKQQAEKQRQAQMDGPLSMSPLVNKIGLGKPILKPSTILNIGDIENEWSHLNASRIAMAEAIERAREQTDPQTETFHNAVHNVVSTTTHYLRVAETVLSTAERIVASTPATMAPQGAGAGNGR